MKHATILTLALVLMAAGAWAAHDLRPGEAVLGETAGAGSSQEFTIDMAAGETITLVVKAKGEGDHAPAIEVSSPRGGRMAFAEGERKMKVAVTAAETGAHRVRLVADEGTAARYVLKVRGERKRRVAERDGAMTIAAVAGSQIRVTVKKGAWVEMRDARGQAQDLEIVGQGRKLRARGEIAATGAYEITWGPADAKASVKITAPQARGDILLSMTPGGSSGVPGGDDPVADGGHDAGDQAGDDAGDASDGEVGNNDGGASNDGTAGNGQNDGTAPPPAPPAPPADYAALRAMATADESDLRAAREALVGYEQEPAGFVAELLQGELDDAILSDIRDALERHHVGHLPAEAALDRMLEIVGAARRAEQAARGAEVLDQEIPGSALAGDPAYEVGRAEAEMALEDLRAAIEVAIEHGLQAMLRGGDDPDAPALQAEAIEPSPERIQALAALDQAVLGGNVLARARAGDEAAAAVIRALYEAYDAMLEALPMVDPNTPQTRAALRQAIDELDAAAPADELELVLAESPMAVEGQPYAVVVRVAGIDDQFQASFDVIDPADLIAEAGPDGFRLEAPFGQPMDVEVRASFEGREGKIRVRVEPRPFELPRRAAHARIVDAASHAPVADVTFELRELGPDGRIAASLDARLLHGKSDAEGRIEMTYLAEGEYELVIRDGESERRMPVIVAPEPQDDRQDLGDLILD
jgi:hypothetical protein